MSETKNNLSQPYQIITNNGDAIDIKVSHIAQTVSDWTARQDWLADWLKHPITLLIFLLGMLTVSAVIYFVFRPLVLRWVKNFISRSDATWDNELMGHGVFRWLTHLLPGIFIFLTAPGLFQSEPF
ncbi:MAG: mechanosensitive ion channel family protein, partial [Akkermansiaceae bacterium]